MNFTNLNGHEELQKMDNNGGTIWLKYDCMNVDCEMGSKAETTRYEKLHICFAWNHINWIWLEYFQTIVLSSQL